MLVNNSTRNATLNGLRNDLREANEELDQTWKIYREKCEAACSEAMFAPQLNNFRGEMRNWPDPSGWVEVFCKVNKLKVAYVDALDQQETA